MRRWLSWVLAGCVLTLAGKAPGQGREERRFLFVVDVSSEMRRCAEATQVAVGSLIQTGAQGRMRRGDLYTMWFFNDTVITNVFPVERWLPEVAAIQAQNASRFLADAKHRKGGAQDAMVAELVRAVRQAPSMTIFFISDWREVMYGTPFDLPISTAYVQFGKELAAQKRPFITTLVAWDDEIQGWSVDAAGGALNIPPIPEKKPPAAEVPPPAPAKPPASVRLEASKPATPKPEIKPSPPPPAKPATEKPVEPPPVKPAPAGPQVAAATPASPPPVPKPGPPAEPTVVPTAEVKPAEPKSVPVPSAPKVESTPPKPPAVDAPPEPKPATAPVEPSPAPPVKPEPTPPPPPPPEPQPVSPPVPDKGGPGPVLPDKPPDAAKPAPATAPGDQQPPAAELGAKPAPPPVPAQAAVVLPGDSSRSAAALMATGAALLTGAAFLAFLWIRRMRAAPQASLISQSLDREQRAGTPPARARRRDSSS
jgi:hypothetical protein